MAWLPRRSWFIKAVLLINLLPLPTLSVSKVEELTVSTILEHFLTLLTGNVGVFASINHSHWDSDLREQYVISCVLTQVNLTEIANTTNEKEHFDPVSVYFLAQNGNVLIPNKVCCQEQTLKEEGSAGCSGAHTIMNGFESSSDDKITWTEPHFSAISKDYVVAGCTRIMLMKHSVLDAIVGVLCVEFKQMPLQFRYKRASIKTHENHTMSTTRLQFAGIKQQDTDDNKCSKGKGSSTNNEDLFSYVNDLVMSYRDSLEASYQIVSQENMSTCPYGSDIYDICGTNFPKHLTFDSASGCGETSYCNSGIYGRGLSVNVTFQTIGNLSHYSNVYKQLCSAHNLTAIWVMSGSLTRPGILLRSYAAPSVGLLQIYPYFLSAHTGTSNDPCKGVEYVFTQYPWYVTAVSGAKMIYLLLWAEQEVNYFSMKNTTSLIIQTLSHYDVFHIEFIVNGEIAASPATDSFLSCNYTNKRSFLEFVDDQYFHNESNAKNMSEELIKAFTTINNTQSSACHQLLMLLTDVPINGSTLEKIKELQATSQVDIFTFMFNDHGYENTSNVTTKNLGGFFFLHDTLSMDEAVSSYYLPYTEQMYNNVTWTYDSNPYCGGDIIWACTPAYNETHQLLGVTCVGVDPTKGGSILANLSRSGSGVCPAPVLPTSSSLRSSKSTLSSAPTTTMIPSPPYLPSSSICAQTSSCPDSMLPTSFSLSSSKSIFSSEETATMIPSSSYLPNASVSTTRASFSLSFITSTSTSLKSFLSTSPSSSLPSSIHVGSTTTSSHSSSSKSSTDSQPSVSITGTPNNNNQLSSLSPVIIGILCVTVMISVVAVIIASVVTVVIQRKYHCLRKLPGEWLTDTSDSMGAMQRLLPPVNDEEIL